MLVKVFSPNQLPSNFMSYSRKIQESHTEVLFIQGYRSDPSGNHVKVDIALCSGDGSKDFPKNCMYVAYYHRSAFSQQFVEYFVSKDMLPLEMLPYYGKSSLHDIMGKSLSENIRIFITKAIVAHNLPLDVVLSNLSIEDEDCSINKEQISSLVSSDDPNSTSPSEEDPIIKMFQSTCTQMKTSDSEMLSGVVLKNVFDALMDVRGLLMKALPQLRSAVADSIVNLIEPVKTFHTFLEGLFQGIVHTQASIHTHTHTHTHMHAHTCTCAYTHTHNTRTHTHTHTRARRHAHTQTHTHTQTFMQYKYTLCSIMHKSFVYAHAHSIKLTSLIF